MINCSTASEERDRFKKHYRVRAFPTVVYLDPQARELDRMKGRKAKEVEAHLRKLAAPFSPFANVKELLSRDGSLQAFTVRNFCSFACRTDATGIKPSSGSLSFKPSDNSNS